MREQVVGNCLPHGLQPLDREEQRLAAGAEQDSFTYCNVLPNISSWSSWRRSVLGARMSVKGWISCLMTLLALSSSYKRRPGSWSRLITSLIMCSHRQKRNIKISLTKWKLENKLLPKLTKNLISSTYKTRNSKTKPWNFKNSVAGLKINIKNYAPIWKKPLTKIKNLPTKSKACKSLSKTLKVILTSQSSKDSNWERLISTWPMKIKP